ncbi:PQQ-dependent sugar dehydrogenase [Maribacter sp. PR1]|uniref:PQQ-dependent sugar dehydrogenase n=1 Tax=Maribacter cobaltidurans TaxID=1178778 RepID=A0ABU7IWD5_9FLAO|nr:MULTISPECIES: PQQ-dependent sugar dehydrogenase [Maribacter]MDC6389814.1 PQQ-dependent sugar dehydrogenase [Maribacter sp. PR1]MEE1977204.1 PQQ-dependent sugar dehydrogenase [Maribacter cobaltidurans]
MKKSVLFLSFFAFLLNNSCAQNPENKVSTPETVPFSAELFVDQLQIPWGFTFLPDGSMLITEKNGDLIHFSNGKKAKISNVPEIYQRGQGGLLDVELHPNYKDNGWIYLSYASPAGDEKGGNTAIMRAKLKGDKLVENQVLYKAVPNTTKGQHFGSRIVFDKQGYLYFSIGERGNRDENPQDITRDGGKIYRLYDDGRIPEDNPFVGRNNAKTAIYSYGHRNPQGLIVNPETGAVWDNEHGPRGGDEINIVKKGANYGWPVITYGINYSGSPITDKTKMEGMEQPIHYWVPSIAPSGMVYITTDKYKDWKGSLLVGSLAFQYLERLELNGTKVTKREKLLDGEGRVRSIEQGPDGLIYVGVEGKGIYKLVPKN